MTIFHPSSIDTLFYEWYSSYARVNTSLSSLAWTQKTKHTDTNTTHSTTPTTHNITPREQTTYSTSLPYLLHHFATAHASHPYATLITSVRTPPSALHRTHTRTPPYTLTPTPYPHPHLHLHLYSHSHPTHTHTPPIPTLTPTPVHHLNPHTHQQLHGTHTTSAPTSSITKQYYYSY